MSKRSRRERAVGLDASQNSEKIPVLDDPWPWQAKLTMVMCVMLAAFAIYAMLGGPRL